MPTNLPNLITLLRIVLIPLIVGIFYVPDAWLSFEARNLAATSVFIFAMNQAKYDSLSPDLKKVIDRNSGQSLSAMAGKAFFQADAEGKKTTAKNTTNVIPKAELENWKKTAQPLFDQWVADMNRKFPELEWGLSVKEKKAKRKKAAKKKVVKKTTKRKKK
mgnify:CR=1 FL=1